MGGGYTNPENGFEEVPDIGLGIERLGHWMELYGLGAETGIELAGETTAPIPSPTWKRRTWGENWSTGDTYNSAFGQGYVLTTPLQMIHILNTIANNGIMTRPTLVREIRDAEGNVVSGFEPDTTDMQDILRDFWPGAHEDEDYPETLDATLQYVQMGMREATTQNFDPVHQGTAIKHQEAMLSIPVAGKTGTAEFCDNIAAALERCIPGAWPAHAWYMGYAPYGNPEISVIAFVYNGQEGATVALPIVAAVMNDYFLIKTRRALEEAQQQQASPQPAVVAPTPGTGPTPIATP
jgi:penicillin-binding protein 2